MFKKIGKAMLAGMPPLGGTEAPFSHAALGPDDVEDARRGRPAIGLQGFAEAMGLAYRDQEMAGAFISTLPRWDNYIFNGMRGTLPGGRYGQLGHELLQVEIGSDGIRMTGTTYASRTTFSNSGLFGRGEAPKDEPFVGNYAFLPTTAVHVRAPETSRLPLMVIIEKSRTALMGNPKLDQYGLPGYRMVGSEHVTDQLTGEFARICQPWLSTRNDPYLRVRVYHGLVNLTVNGYRSDPADLRHLLQATEAIADGLAGMMAGAPTPPFDAPGPDVGSLTLPGVSRPFPAYSTAFAEAARVYGMHDEDPLHLMSMQPRNPIPGLPWGVLFGTPHGAGRSCRLVWHNQGGRTTESVRGGIITVARPGVDTPVGGLLHEPTAMYVEVVDGVAYCWNQRRHFGELGSAPLIEQGLATLRATGVADI